MRLFIATASMLTLLFALDGVARADGALSPVRSDIKAKSKTDNPGVRCRALQRTAQTMIAVEGFDSLKQSAGHTRALRRPRKLIASIVGDAEKRKSVGRGCYRCIARQFRRHVPIGKQLACGAHDICVAGGALKRTLSPCVAAVCSGAQSCCQRQWDGQCVTAASETCGDPCIPCSHDQCESGAALDATCSTCVASICAVDPFCCDTSWSDDCVAEIATVCGEETCASTASVPAPSTTTIETGSTIPGGTTSTEPAGPTSTVVEGSTVPGGPGSTVTVPEGSTLPGGGVTTSTLGGVTTSTLSGGATTSVPAGPTTTVESPGTTVTETPGSGQCEDDVIDFEELPAGSIVSVVHTSQNQIVTIKGNNPRLPGLNSAVIYDSTCTTGWDADHDEHICTGRDTDLGTPNQDFGGPGIGDGGAKGSPTQNDESLHNLLIVATYLTDVDNDGLVDDPNDQKIVTTTREIDFSAFAPVSVLSLKLVDVGDTEGPAKVELFDVLGNLVTSANAPNAENNGLVKLDMPPNDGVWKMIVTMHGSGGMDEIRLGCPGGSTTTIGPVTTTVGPTTSTTVAGPTTTVAATTTTQPAPTTTQPAPTTTQPAPTTTQPAPTTTQPAPTTTQPAPTTTLVGPTTTAPAPTTTVPPTTVPPTTTSTTTTTSSTTTTTALPGPCPSSATLTVAAGTGATCTSNADCAVGTCDTGLGRCHTVTELDSGWTGIAHDADVTDNLLVKANLDNCAGSGGACGQCDIAGINPEPRNCRCSNDNTKVCNQPFAADAANCGGQVCNCYVGPPLALSAGNTPACIVNRLATDVSGTVNVDEGSVGSPGTELEFAL